mmetsp:Transcript_14994/g.37753  ORF Transcript_14994/g.37753 Transcript_14994/m.37753 type:complete len:263 (+) Transcript_14994:965-1753(+)
MGSVLLYHDSLEDAGVSQLSTRNFFDLGVPFDIHRGPSSGCGLHYRRDGLDGHFDQLIVPARGKLGSNAAQHQLGNPILVLFDVNRHCQIVADLQGICECLGVSLANNGGVVPVHQKGLGCRKDLCAQNNDRGGSIPNLFVLGPRELNHRFGGGMTDVNLAQNTVSVVCHDNSSHGIQQHFEHGLGSQRRPNNGGNCLGGTNVSELCLTTGLSLGFGIQDHNLSRTGSWSHHRHCSCIWCCLNKKVEVSRYLCCSFCWSMLV